MKYDFENVIRRENSGSGKWNEIKEVLGYFPEEIIPFSVADMEFDMVPEVREGLKKGRTSKVGIGFGNIYKRIDSIYQKGSFRIYSRKGCGTVVQMFIPQDEEVEEYREENESG
mgnify:CR=1 FL=1